MAFFDFIKNLFTGKKDNTNKNSTSAENPMLFEAVKSLVKNQITLVPDTTDKVKYPYSSKLVASLICHHTLFGLHTLLTMMV